VRTQHPFFITRADVMPPQLPRDLLSARRYRSFLEADLSIDCQSPLHHSYQACAGVMMAVYPFGVPLCLGVLCYLARHDMATVTRQLRAQEADRSTPWWSQSEQLSNLMKTKVHLRGWLQPITVGSVLAYAQRHTHRSLAQQRVTCAQPLCPAPSPKPSAPPRPCRGSGWVRRHALCVQVPSGVLLVRAARARAQGVPRRRPRSRRTHCGGTHGRHDHLVSPHVCRVLRAAVRAPTHSPLRRTEPIATWPPRSCPLPERHVGRPRLRHAGTGSPRTTRSPSCARRRSSSPSSLPCTSD
jgi:hypothetical protein